MYSQAQPDQEVEIFTGPNCSYCGRAKAVLARRNIKYREVDVRVADGRDEMQRRLPLARTIPQIFINGEHIGGCEDLEQLDADGVLGTVDRP